MRTLPAALVELDDATTWIRVGGKMIAVEPGAAGWLLAPLGAVDAVEVVPAAPAALPPASQPVKKVAGKRTRNAGPTKETPTPVAAAKRSRKGSTPPELIEKARRMIEEEGASFSATAKAVGRTDVSVANWAKRDKWLTPAKRKKARGLVETRDYSIVRAAGAVDVPVATVQAVADREGWGSPQARPAAAPGSQATTTKRVRCQHCRQLTPASSPTCQNCFGRHEG